MQDILINWSPQETRVAVVENGAVQELHVERTLERARVLVGEILAGPDGGGTPQPGQAHRDDRLAALCALLDLSEAGASPAVRQHSVSPGSLQLF